MSSTQLSISVMQIHGLMTCGQGAQSTWLKDDKVEEIVCGFFPRKGLCECQALAEDLSFFGILGFWSDQTIDCGDSHVLQCSLGIPNGRISLIHK